MSYAIPDPRFEAPELLDPNRLPTGLCVIDESYPYAKNIKLYLQFVNGVIYDIVTKQTFAVDAVSTIENLRLKKQAPGNQNLGQLINDIFNSPSGFTIHSKNDHTEASGNFMYEKNADFQYWTEFQLDIRPAISLSVTLDDDITKRVITSSSFYYDTGTQIHSACAVNDIGNDEFVAYVDGVSAGSTPAAAAVTNTNDLLLLDGSRAHVLQFIAFDCPLPQSYVKKLHNGEYNPLIPT